MKDKQPYPLSVGERSLFSVDACAKASAVCARRAESRCRESVAPASAILLDAQDSHAVKDLLPALSLTVDCMLTFVMA